MQVLQYRSRCNELEATMHSSYHDKPTVRRRIVRLFVTNRHCNGVLLVTRHVTTGPGWSQEHPEHIGGCDVLRVHIFSRT